MTDPAIRFASGTVGAHLEAAGKLKHDTVAALVDGALADLQWPLSRDGAAVEPLKASDPAALSVIRHSTSHIMADAVQQLFPGTKVTIGPSIDTGFYYDFDRPEGPFTDEELVAIEARMQAIIDEAPRFRREEITREDARVLFEKLGESYKLELLDAIDADRPVTLYRHGNWVDLCAGPHLPDTKAIRAIKLLSVAGAYWRGDERNKMLARIYGTAFHDRKELKAYLDALEEAKKRDHRKLGKELDLFSIDEQVGGGLVLWHPKGALVRTLIENHWRQVHLKNGYELIMTPHIGRGQLWETSGHLENYADNMYAPMDIEGNPYYIKPMNCPFHIAIYRNSLKSYRDLPIRWAELGTVYRFERSGQLHGLLRVRGFTQDDAHLFIRVDQLESEIRGVVRFTLKLLADYGFRDLDVMVATRPEGKSIGDPAIWEKAESALKAGLEAEGVTYTIDEGGGAFYGPKIDVKIKDAIGRVWQCSTVQVDFNLPERFDLSYIGDDTTRHRAVMIHRALLGSIERFFGIMVEHYAGAFPMWLAPVQVALLTVADRHVSHAQQLSAELTARGIRVSIDDDNEKLGAKIRRARLSRVPATAVIGDREVESGGVSLTTRSDGELGYRSAEEFIDFIVRGAKAPEILDIR